MAGIGHRDSSVVPCYVDRTKFRWLPFDDIPIKYAVIQSIQYGKNHNEHVDNYVYIKFVIKHLLQCYSKI